MAEIRPAAELNAMGEFMRLTLERSMDAWPALWAEAQDLTHTERQARYRQYLSNGNNSNSPKED